MITIPYFGIISFIAVGPCECNIAAAAAAATSSAHGLGGHRQDGGRPRARREGSVTALAVLELAGLQCWHDGVDGRSQVVHGGLEGEQHGCCCCSSTGDVEPIAMVSPAAHIAAIPSR